jgi:hypothetical protein
MFRKKLITISYSTKLFNKNPIPTLNVGQYKNYSVQESGVKSNYDIEYQKSLSDPIKYWQSRVDLIEWIERPKLILDKSNPPFEKWYAF